MIKVSVMYPNKEGARFDQKVFFAVVFPMLDWALR